MMIIKIIRKKASLSNKENLENKEEECISNENNKDKDKDEKR